VSGFSPIQNHILSKLKNAKILRYSELQLKGVPNDLFNYHLQFLVKKDYVNRSDEGYSLAEKGIKHVADPDVLTEEEKIASLFKFNVITIVSRVNNGQIEILSQVRKSHPSFGRVGVMGGIVRKGEGLEDAATRKLKAETGLEADFRIMGIQRRIMYRNNELFSDVLFPIAYANHHTGELLAETEYGSNFWASLDEAIKNESGEFDTLRKISDVLKAIKNGSLEELPVFYEEDIQSQA
jgi:ADP-ribose pyrophosphatase YjhB (NUDIX family)